MFNSNQAFPIGAKVEISSQGLYTRSQVFIYFSICLKLLTLWLSNIIKNEPKYIWKDYKIKRAVVNSFHDLQKSRMRYCHMRSEWYEWLCVMVFNTLDSHFSQIFFSNYLKDNAKTDPTGRLGQVFIFMEEKLLWNFHSRNIGWF
jgi:hypothetical protein